MRILHDNIIDDLDASSLSALTTSTGFSVINVQEQRLSQRWVSNTATIQSVTVTLPLFPEYPDSAAGTQYKSNWSAGVDGWAANLTASNMSVLATGETLYLDATSTSIYNYMGIIKTGVGWATGYTILVKTGYDSDLSSLGYYNGTSYTSLTGIQVQNDMYYSASMLRGSTYTSLTMLFQYASTAIAITKNFPVESIYVGSAAYTAASVITDLSGNGNDMPMIGPLVAGSSIITDGVNDYGNANIKGAFAIEHGVTMAAWITPRSSAANGYVWAYLGTATNNRFYLRVNSTSTLSAVFNTGEVKSVDWATNEYGHIAVVRNPGTTSYSIYKNGSLYSSSSLTVADGTGVVSNIRYFYDGASAFGSHKVEDIRLYSRDLQASEVAHLYNNERWVNEYDALTAWYYPNYDIGVRAVSVLGHNLNPGSQVKIQATSIPNNWIDPPVDETLTITPETILKFLSADYYYKYWRFYFTQQASIEIGRLWLGRYMTIDPSSLLNFKVVKLRSDNVFHGRNRQKWASVGAGWRRFELTFPKSDEVMIYQLASFYDSVGNHSSFIFCNFDTIRDYVLVEPCYVSLASDIDFKHDDRMGFTYDLIMEEEL